MTNKPISDYALLLTLLSTTILVSMTCNFTQNKYLSTTNWSSSIIAPFGAIVRMDTTQPFIYLIFSGHDHNEGRIDVLRTLADRNIKASFFFTGDFYRNPENKDFIETLIRENHYLGAHSDQHLLYADWINRDSTLVSRDSFEIDLKANYRTMETMYGIMREQATVFLPPYEWYNKEIVEWTSDMGFTLINLTPGPGTARDYTWPELGSRYTTSDTIITDLMDYEENFTLNGVILLIHLGTDNRRPDKLYDHLGELLDKLSRKGYGFRRF